MALQNAINKYRRALTLSSKDEFSDSTTHLHEAANTVVNTMLEMSLPGFLLIDFYEALQPGPALKVKSRALAVPFAHAPCDLTCRRARVAQ